MATSDHPVRTHRIARDTDSGASGTTYALAVDGLALGLLHKGKGEVAFTWDGAVSFDRLTEEANSAFAAMGAHETEDYPAEASFIMRSNQLVTVNLIHEEREGEALLATILSAPSDIAYARYDVAIPDNWGGAYPDAQTFAFAADNPRTVSDEEGPPSISIQLPWGQDWRKELTQWVLDHHVQAKWLKGRVDRADETIQTIMREGED